MHLAQQDGIHHRMGRVFGVTWVGGVWRFQINIRPPLPMILLLPPVSGKNERELQKEHVSFRTAHLLVDVHKP